MMRSRPSLALAAAISPVAAACADSAATERTVRADSAGIAVATAVEPLWAQGEGWTIASEPAVEIGTVAGAPEYQFADVVAAVRLGNGDIVVADRGAFELRGYDASGAFQWRAGRFGEGPGEFESLDFLGVADADSLVAYDGSLMRAQIFGPGGEMRRTLRVAVTEGEGAGEGLVADKAVGVVDGRLVVRFIEYGDGIPSGVARWPLERLVAVDLSDGAGRTLMVLPGHEAHVRPRGGGGYSHGAYVFFRGPEYAAAAGRLAVIDTEAWSVRLVSPRDGRIIAVHRRHVPPREATAALFSLHLDGIVEIAFPDPDAAAPEDVERLRRMWSELPRAPQLPVLRSVHADAAGNLWLEPYHVAGAEPPPFEVHAPDGDWLGSVSIPAGRKPAYVQYQAPYMEIGEDYILGVWTDDLDVQHVRMYRIDKQAS